MTITVNENLSVLFPTEKSVTIRQSVQPKHNSAVHFHPWSEGVDGRAESEVYIAVGRLKKDGNGRYRKKDKYDPFHNAIVNRDDFVEAVLAVFPELVRVDDAIAIANRIPRTVVVDA